MDISKDVEEAAKDGLSAEFTYSVQWHETDITFDKRMDKYRKYQFLPEHLDVRHLPGLPLHAAHADMLCLLWCEHACRDCHVADPEPLHCCTGHNSMLESD